MRKDCDEEPVIDDEMEGWGDSEEDEGIDASKAAPFIYLTEDSSHILVVPQAFKEIKLPGTGKKGGCDDWQVRVMKEKSEDGSPKYILESKGGQASARLLDSILNSKHGINFSADSACPAAPHPGSVLPSAIPKPEAPLPPREEAEKTKADEPGAE
eukprot:s788_g5.t1